MWQGQRTRAGGDFGTSWAWEFLGWDFRFLSGLLGPLVRVEFFEFAGVLGGGWGFVLLLVCWLALVAHCCGVVPKPLGQRAFHMGEGIWYPPIQGGTRPPMVGVVKCSTVHAASSGMEGKRGAGVNGRR